MSKGDAETGAAPTVGTASAGGAGVGVDRVTLGIPSRNRDPVCSRVFGREEQKWHLSDTKSETFRYNLWFHDLYQMRVLHLDHHFTTWYFYELLLYHRAYVTLLNYFLHYW